MYLKGNLLWGVIEVERPVLVVSVFGLVERDVEMGHDDEDQVVFVEVFLVEDKPKRDSVSGSGSRRQSYFFSRRSSVILENDSD